MTFINLRDRWMRLTLSGLVVGILGLGIQWIADPSKFGFAFPPGIYFIVGFGLATVLTSRWWWSSIFAVVISAFIIFGGIATDKLQPNLVSHNLGTVAGNAIMSIGLIAAVIVGVVTMVSRARRRSRRPVAS